ncbi:MAG: HAD-IIIC family phosphatase [Lachnospiraceae bacterium]|nr:HAD-IIIC family phosphatase [uncultured Acetatifactor sp.]MCI9220022.1 HAD-IIIC family phosphatase [Lachnospiraceae bacterium]
MSHRIAVLSNVNMNFAVRMLARELAAAEPDTALYQPEGYGNELGTLLDVSSSYEAFAPDITFLIMDVLEAVDHDPDAGSERIESWFASLKAALHAERLYYVSDAFLWGPEAEILRGDDCRGALEYRWQECLRALCAQCPNVRILPYRHVIEEMGAENAFSLKMWYMGRILHTNEAQKRIVELLLHIIRLQRRIPKKVLLLDLDNTLWGGLAGEADHTPIMLSGEHTGLMYRNLQRVIAGMQKQGVLLGIVSKNNEKDAMDIISSHPQMVLRPEDFVAMKINWRPKPENIAEIARELNLGLDSFVFWDDSPAERTLVKASLPQVTVPDFPDRPEELTEAMVRIYRQYFEQAAVTSEDRQKTRQYAENAKRSALKTQALDFASYLRQLAMEISRESPEANSERLTQLVNKTNQFNLTTKRYEPSAMQGLLQDAGKRVYLYRVKDCFGDNGIVAAVIVDLTEAVPMIDTFVMSCRVMGRNIENAIIEDIERELYRQGYTSLRAKYLPTAKNRPVENLFEKLDYRILAADKTGEKLYEITLAPDRRRDYCARWTGERPAP